MKRTRDLETEINSLEEKQSRLQSDLEAAERAHTQAKEAVVQVGDQASLETVTSAHSRVTALTDALATLETQVEDKRRELKAAVEKERQETVRGEIETRKTNREQARLDYLRARDRANEALKEPIGAMSEAVQRFTQEGAEIRRLASSVGTMVQLSDKLGVSELQPFGYEVDQAYARLIRISAREAEEARAEERRLKRLQRPAA